MRLTLVALLFASVAATEEPTFSPTSDFYGLCFYDDQCLFSCGDALTAEDCLDYVGVLGGLGRRILMEKEEGLSPRLQRLLDREDDYYAHLNKDNSAAGVAKRRELQATQPPLNIAYFKSGECLNSPGGFFNQECCVPTSSGKLTTFQVKEGRVASGLMLLITNSSSLWQN